MCVLWCGTSDEVACVCDACVWCSTVCVCVRGSGVFMVCVHLCAGLCMCICMYMCVCVYLCSTVCVYVCEGSDVLTVCVHLCAGLCMYMYVVWYV